MPPPFHLHHDASNFEPPTAARIVITLLVGSILPAALVFGRPRLKRILATHADRRRLRKIANESDRKRNRTKEVEKGAGADGAIVISGLYVHPVKSLRPVPVSSSSISHLGLSGDRSLMLVRPRPQSLTSPYDPSAPTHRFVTQRQCPQLARIDASVPTAVGEGDGSRRRRRGRVVVRLRCDLLSEEDGDGDGNGDDGENEEEAAVHVDVSPDAVVKWPVRYTAGLWDDAVVVADAGDDAAEFVRRAIKEGIAADKAAGIKLETDDAFGDVRLVALLPGVTRRPLPEAYLPPAARTALGGVPQTSLNDGFPILVANESSLDELNKRLVERGKEPLPMSRFRPNVVVRGDGLKPFEEDAWKAIRIRSPDGEFPRRETILHLVKGCPRCKQSCTDQISGERHAEPLETLATFRAVNPRCGEDVYFGQNAVPQVGLWAAGGLEVRVGDVVEVLTRGEPVWDKEDVRAE